jgi:hypothetical protein
MWLNSVDIRSVHQKVQSSLTVPKAQCFGDCALTKLVPHVQVRPTLVQKPDRTESVLNNEVMKRSLTETSASLQEFGLGLKQPRGCVRRVETGFYQTASVIGSRHAASASG